MSTLLRIDSSPQSRETSFSRRLTSEFVSRWSQAHPDGRVITRDLAATSLVPVDAEWIAAAHTPEVNLTPRQKELLGASEELIGELQHADEYIIGVAMHNFSIPSVLKLWIDQVVRSGKTFAYANGAPAGLLQGKKATFIVASGGVYEPGTPRAAMNFVEPYLRAVFAMLGVTDVAFIYAGGTAQVRYGVEAATILQPAMASIGLRVQALPGRMAH
jgi:FMN-dependent NADH-azoreductase